MRLIFAGAAGLLAAAVTHISAAEMSSSPDYHPSYQYPHFNASSLAGYNASCGSVMATYNNVPAKSNGGDMGTGSCCGGSVSTGCAYQCVEFAQRYFAHKHGTAKVWGCNANGMCGDGCRAKGVKKTKDPQPGDLYVMDTGSYGHVAVVNKIDGSDVHVYEQNWASSGRNVHPKSQALCFLTAGHTPTPAPPPPPPTPPHSCPRPGFYCGNDAHLGLDPNTLYNCKAAGQAPVSSAKCAFTCATHTKGTDDACAPGSCAGVNDGNYCGHGTHACRCCATAPPRRTAPCTLPSCLPACTLCLSACASASTVLL